MSVHVSYTCDRCGDDQDEDIEFGDFVPDLPTGWHVDPEDDEQHLCEECWDELYPPLAGHPDPARALMPPTGPTYAWGDHPRAERAYSGELCPCGVVHRAPKEPPCE